MSTLVAVIVLQGYISGGRRWVREHAPRGDDGASTLELVIIILGLMAVATILVVAITLAVQRRVDQIT